MRRRCAMTKPVQRIIGARGERSRPMCPNSGDSAALAPPRPLGSAAMATAEDVAQLQVRLLHPAAAPPARTRPGDAGYDLRSVEAFALAPGERAVVPTGVALALPPGVAGLVIPRSGLAARHGLSVVNGPGLIDPNYRGEIRVILVNLGGERF